MVLALGEFSLSGMASHGAKLTQKGKKLILGAGTLFFNLGEIKGLWERK